jgi:hypothetical protein
LCRFRELKRNLWWSLARELRKEFHSQELRLFWIIADVLDAYQPASKKKISSEKGLNLEIHFVGESKAISSVLGRKFSKTKTKNEVYERLGSRWKDGGNIPCFLSVVGNNAFRPK